MKKILSAIFEATSFLLLVALVFAGSVLKVVKTSFYPKNTEGVSKYKTTFNYALADAPAGGGGGGAPSESCEAAGGGGGGGGNCC